MIPMYFVLAYVRSPFTERVHDRRGAASGSEKKESLLPESESLARLEIVDVWTLGIRPGSAEECWTRF